MSAHHGYCLVVASCLSSPCATTLYNSASHGALLGNTNPKTKAPFHTSHHTRARESESEEVADSLIQFHARLLDGWMDGQVYEQCKTRIEKARV